MRPAYKLCGASAIDLSRDKSHFYCFTRRSTANPLFCKQIFSLESRIRNTKPRRCRVTSSDTWEEDMMDRNPPTLRLRTVFISDIHLGFKGCSADLLLDFLHHVEMDTLFLVGDIIDVWSMQRSMFWPQSHNNVLRTILGKAKRGTKVIFVPGNHDDVFREFDGAVFGNLEIHREYIHQGADGRRMLVLHGDEYDSVVQCSPWLAKLGSNLYDVLLAANPYINWVRRKFELP